MAQCQGPRAHMVRLFLIFIYIWQDNVAKIPKVLGAQRNVNPARAITCLVGATNLLLDHFSITTHLHLASFYATKYF